MNIVPDWDLLKEPRNALAFQNEVNRLFTKAVRKNVKSLNDAIIEAAKATIPCCSRNHKDWFKLSKIILFAAINARNKAFSKLSTDPMNVTRQKDLQKARRTVKYIVRLAKARHQEQFVKDTSAKNWAKSSSWTHFVVW
jgi:hypothetical protein